MGDSDGKSVLYEKISVEYLLGAFGLATAFSTALSILSVFPGGEAIFLRVVPSTVFIALFMVIGFFLISAFQEKIASAKRSPLIVCEFVGMVLMCFLSVAEPWLPKIACYVFVAIVALGSVSLLCTWFCWVCAQDSLRAPFLVAVGCLFACVACLLESLLVGGLGNAAICILYAASLFAAIVMKKRGVTSNIFPYISSAESDRRSKIMPESTIKFSVDSFQFGLVVGVSCLSGTGPLCFVAGCLAAGALIADGATGKRITERTLSMYAPPLTAAALCSLFLFGDYARMGSLCLITVLFVFATCVGWMAMVGHVKMSRLSPLRIFSKARRVQYLATAAGAAFGCFAVGLASVDWLLAVRIFVVLSLVVTFVFSVLHKSRFPETGLEDDGSISAGSKGMWAKRCKALSDSCGLSERQREVLVLIAQGRSAKYVEQELSISLSTAQTHIRNIYRKVGVHSRQELLDEIESTKLYGED